jgi:hypothetical protein
MVKKGANEEEKEEDGDTDFRLVKKKLLVDQEIVSIQSTKYVYIGKDMGWNTLTLQGYTCQ